jgi:hypothetical protein
MIAKHLIIDYLLLVEYQSHPLTPEAHSSSNGTNKFI